MNKFVLIRPNLDKNFKFSLVRKCLKFLIHIDSFFFIKNII